MFSLYLVLFIDSYHTFYVINRFSTIEFIYLRSVYLDRGAYLYNSPEFGQMGLYLQTWMNVPNYFGNPNLLITNNFSENSLGSIGLVICYIIYCRTNNFGS